MDNLRGTFDSGDPVGEGQDWDALDDEDSGFDPPPQGIGQDERRMQVRAYNHWASLLGDNTFPSIEELEPHNLSDFGPHSVLLDFSAGIDDPAVQFIGDKLGEECGATIPIRKLSDVPPRSLLSRITDHYMQILANQAPIGFEAEFVNLHGAAILYRGILLPFSSNDETIDFIYGVINWKEIADQVTSDELLLEIDQALDGEEPVEDEDEPHKHHADPVTEWADSPAAETGDEPLPDPGAADRYNPETDDEVPGGVPAAPVEEEVSDDTPADIEAGDDFAFGSDEGGSNIASFGSLYASPVDDNDLPLPDFGQYALEDPDDEDGEESDEEGAGYSFASLADYIETPAKKAVDLDADQFDPGEYQPEYSGEDGEGSTFGDGEDDDISGKIAASEYEPVGGDAEDGEDEESSLDDEPVIDLSDYVEMPDAPDAPSPEGNFAAFELGEAEEIEPADEHGPVETGDHDVPTPADEPVEDARDTDAIAAAFEQAPAAIDADAGLHDCLASARDLAENARVSEDRSRTALYAAVSRAYDFSLAAKAEPDGYAELLEDNGLTVQDRAPMTPVVKLVFGADYDKTRLTEYAAVLAHAHRHGLERGALEAFLAEADGGLKGVVAAERRLRREEAGKPVENPEEVRAKLAEKLRELEALTFDAVSGDGAEFSLVMVRRDGAGDVAVIGQIEDDTRLIERAARKLIG